jgi:glucosylglycerate hydrolase
VVDRLGAPRMEWHLQNESLRNAALAVLKKNDLGDWTRPAPRLYPHQWSWDSAFIALGLADVDADRALREIETLFKAQWSDGRVPHIVFNPEAADYFPGPERWASASTSARAPRDVATSGLIQPPVHAIAVQRILEVGRSRGLSEIQTRIAALMPKLLQWHRYLATSRDPNSTGLLLMYHPWESGTDNSPRWDSTLARIEVGDVPAYQRHDLKHVADPSERPTHAEYDRYLWLVELLKKAHYDDATIYNSNYPFRVRDVLMSAIFAAASHALAQVSETLGASKTNVTHLELWAQRSSHAVQAAWDGQLELALDRDDGSNEAVRVETCAGLAPLLVPDLSTDLCSRVLKRLNGPGFAGAPDLGYAVVPSTAPGSPGFQSRSYWRGPSWPVANWLLWWGMRQHGRMPEARQLRDANLALLGRPGAQFAEYFEPFTAEPLGSLEQSWTAAVALDWLSSTEE